MEKELNLESLSNGDLSRVDANSALQRSYTNLQQQFEGYRLRPNNQGEEQNGT